MSQSRVGGGQRQAAASFRGDSCSSSSSSSGSHVTQVMMQGQSAGARCVRMDERGVRGIAREMSWDARFWDDDDGRSGVY